MNVSERCLKFAAECELMAKFTSSPENEVTWHRMAERWIRCAELSERQELIGSRWRPEEAASETRMELGSLGERKARPGRCELVVGGDIGVR